MAEIKQMSENGLKFGVIYGLYHPITNELRYIGQTAAGLKKRLSKHISDSNSVLRRQNTHVACWIRSLLELNLAPEIRQIEECVLSELDNKEVYYISYYKSIGYNLTNSHLGGQVKRIFSEETRRNMSEALMGHKQSDTTKEKRRIAVTQAWENPILREQQRIRTTELNKLGIIGTKGKPSNKKGIPFAGDREAVSRRITEYFSFTENRNKSALSHGQKPFVVYRATMLSRANRFRKKSVIQIGEQVLEHINLCEAATILGINRVNAQKSLSGEREIVQGYIFKYKTAI